MSMNYFSVLQVVYLLFSLASAGLYLIATILVFSWPEFRSRGLFLSAVALKFVAALLYGLTHLLQVVALGSSMGSYLTLLQFVYVVLTLVGLAADVLLVAAIYRLGQVLRQMKRAQDPKSLSPFA